MYKIIDAGNLFIAFFPLRGEIGWSGGNDIRFYYLLLVVVSVNTLIHTQIIGSYFLLVTAQPMISENFKNI